MTRVQILLEKKEVQILKKKSLESGKSYSQLVRDAIDNLYLSRFSEQEIKKMAGEAKRSAGSLKFKNLQAARGYLLSL